jgi:hypothetical protein
VSAQVRIDVEQLTPQSHQPAREEKHGPRICMPTIRKFSKNVFRSAFYEAQDILCEVDEVDLVSLEPGPGFEFKSKLQRRFLYHDFSHQILSWNPGLQKTRLSRGYDLFVAACQNIWDIPNLNAIEQWKNHCKVSACWIDELWASSLPGYKHWLPALKKFDYVFISQSETAVPLSKALGRTCYWLPRAVDALRFSPYPNPPIRSIDVYSMGRRWEGIHSSLLRASTKKEIFYFYDTSHLADTAVYNHREHREFYANVAKRSKYFLVAPGLMTAPNTTGGQAEFGYRYFEGLTAGAVMIGQKPNTDSFRSVFPDPEMVIEIQSDGSDVLDILALLGSQPERVSNISRKNTAAALLKHDWVYRWKEIFRVVGVDPTPAMADRELRLKELADFVTNTAE